MSADIVHGRVVLVLLSVRCVRVQAISELRVPFVQLPGQGLVTTNQGLAELSGCIAHGFRLGKGSPKRAAAEALLPAKPRLPPPAPPPPFTTGPNLEQHGLAFSYPVSKKKKKKKLIRKY